MAIQLVFSKSEDKPWGFRLTGGADCEIPLTVIKIAEGGVADVAGMQVGDVILKINDRDAEELSHIEAHDVLIDAGLNFTMTVWRDNEDYQDDTQHNEEVRYILNQSVEDIHEEDLPSATDLDSWEKSKVENTVKNLSQRNAPRVHFDDIIVEHPKTEEENTPELKQKKWSTFLQKPSRPIVIPKKNDLQKPMGEPYKVIIKKQPKKGTEEVVQENFDESSNEIEDHDITSEIHEEDDSYIEPEVEEEYDEVEEKHENEENTQVDFDEEDYIREETPVVEEVAEKHVTLEEKLAEIQQQLQSLAQVPTSIQDTLEALTEQLAKIVGVPQTQQPLDEDMVVYEENENEDYAENNQDSILEDVAEIEDSADEYKLDITDTTEFSEDEADNSQISNKKQNIKSSEDVLKIKQAEEEAMQREKEEHEKFIKQDRTEEFHQRRLEQRPTIPLAPVQRPIILPGGRKWSDPDDAVPKPRKSKMTDEKICETLDNYSEIVAGHTKGINFLKYQPAPKNLDYLQRSEVFRLVHDMDPPKSGIAARSGAIVSEEDYYKNDTGHRSALKA